MTAASRPFSEADVVAEFGDALRAAGLRLKGLPVMDGQWHRAAIDGDKGRKTSGRYRGYLDGRPAGFIENFKDPTRTGPWKFGIEAPRMSAADRAAAERAMDALKAARTRAEEARIEEVAQESAAAWERAAPAPDDHPYLAAKNIPADGLRVNAAGHLLMPMRDFAGRLRALQTIAPDGSKRFPLGSRVRGLHLLLDELHDGAPLLVAEGYATAATLRQATGLAVAVAFAKTNFIPIARHYAERFSGLRIGFCGDNDHHLPRRDPPLVNVGREAAEEAAQATKGTAIIPAFEPHEVGTDWNDWAATHGLDAVWAAVEAALPPPPPPPPKPYYPAPESTREEAQAALKRKAAGFFDHAVSHTAAAAAWREKKAALDEVLPPKSPGRRKALRAARAEMAAEHGPDWNAPGRLLLLPAAAGSGKTKLTAAEIAARPHTLGRVAYYTDSLANAEAVAAQIPSAQVVRGRSAPDPKSPNGARMCLRHKAAEAVAFAGLSVSQTLCRDAAGRTCPLIDRCGYQRDAAARREAAVSVGSHEYLTLRGGMPRPDVAVIDENCVSTLIGHIEFCIDRLQPIDMPNWQLAGLAAATAYREVMARVAEAVRDPAGILAGLRTRGIATEADFRPALDYLRAVEDAEYTSGITPTMGDDEVIERMGRHAQSEIRGVLKLLTALQQEIGLPRDHSHGVAYHPDKPVTVDGQQERQNRISVHYRKDLAFGAGVPVLLLDASGDEEIYRALLGERLTAATAVRCERNAEVVQVIDATLPRSSLLGADRRGNALSETAVERADALRAEMVATANALAAKHGGEFMLATNKAVVAAVTAEHVEAGVSAAVLTAHFGALRGRNDYENCAAGMVLGRNQPPAAAMEAMARAIWSDDPEQLEVTNAYEKATRGIRMRDGSAVPVDVDVHKDPRVQRVLELHRERESEQAADRLRLVHNEERKPLYVASNLPLDLTVDRVVMRQALVHEATGRRDNGRQGKGRRLYANRLVEAYGLSGGILPLSRAELVRLSADKSSVFNGLWMSEAAVRNDFGNTAVSAIGSLLAETAILNPRLVSYRCEGQRRPSWALVSPHIPDGRAALQALLGRPVVAYEVEDAPDPPEPPDPPRPPAPPPTHSVTELPAFRTEEQTMPHATDPPGAELAAPEPQEAALAPSEPPQAAVAAPEPSAELAAFQRHIAAANSRLAVVSSRLNACRPPRLFGDGNDDIREWHWRRLRDLAQERAAERLPPMPAGALPRGGGALGLAHRPLAPED